MNILNIFPLDIDITNIVIGFIIVIVIGLFVTNRNKNSKIKGNPNRPLVPTRPDKLQVSIHGATIAEAEDIRNIINATGYAYIFNFWIKSITVTNSLPFWKNRAVAEAHPKKKEIYLRRGAYERSKMSTLMHELHHIYVYQNKLQKDAQGLVTHVNADSCGILINGGDPKGTCFFLEAKEVAKHS